MTYYPELVAVIPTVLGSEEGDLRTGSSTGASGVVGILSKGELGSCP